jgi:uncharacterized DUF497 family protein
MGLNLHINCSPGVLEKLRNKHHVSELEISQCFINRDGMLLEDLREDHKTDPTTEWFIAETHKGRKLKVCFVQVGTEIDIKTAYEPNDQEIRIYNEKAY